MATPLMPLSQSSSVPAHHLRRSLAALLLTKSITFFPFK